MFGLDVDNAVRVVEQDRTSQTGTNITGRIKVFTGDQGDPDFLRSLCTKIGRIDFIIDDASHIPWHQILGLEMLFPCLNPAGGVYMVEDLTDDARGKFVLRSILDFLLHGNYDISQHVLSCALQEAGPLLRSLDDRAAPNQRLIAHAFENTSLRTGDGVWRQVASTAVKLGYTRYSYMGTS